MPNNIESLQYVKDKYGINSLKYRDEYKKITGKNGVLTTLIDDDTVIAPTLDEVVVRPTNYLRGELVGSKVSKSIDKFGRNYTLPFITSVASLPTGLLILPTTKIISKFLSPYTKPIIKTGKEIWNHPVTLGILAADGIYNLASDNGITKTYRHFRDKEYLKGTLSGLVDIADFSGIYDLYKGANKTIRYITNNGKYIYNFNKIKDRFNTGNRLSKSLRNMHTHMHETTQSFNKLINDELKAISKLEELYDDIFRKVATQEGRIYTPRFFRFDNVKNTDKTVNAVYAELKKDPKYSSKIRFTDNGIEIYDESLLNSAYNNIGVNVGKFELPKYGTTEKFSGNIGYTSSGKNNYTIHNKGADIYQIDNILDDSNKIQFDVPNEYPKIMLSNIDYISSLVPGFKPYGSSVAVAKLNYPHITHDIDGYIPESSLKFINKYETVNVINDPISGKPSTITKKIPINNKGDYAEIDFNIIYNNSNDIRTMQLLRQTDPNKYEKLVESKLIGEKVKLDNTEKLLQHDEIIKTVMDSLESSKPKHLPRKMIHLINTDTDILKESINKLGKSILGENYKPAALFSLEQLSDVDKNKKLLKLMGYSTGIQNIAEDPNRMQAAIDFWFLKTSTSGRGVTNDGKHFDSLREWDSSSLGGNALGAGLNTVEFGNSGHGPIYGFILPKLNVDVSSPESFIQSTKRQFGDYSYNLNLNEQLIISNIIEKYLNEHIEPSSFKTPVDILDNIPQSGPESKQILNEISQKLGIDAITRKYLYGTGNYRSINRPLREHDDNIFLTFGEVYPGWILQSNGTKASAEKILNLDNPDISKGLEKINDIRRKRKDLEPPSKDDTILDRLIKKHKKKSEQLHDLSKKIEEELINRYNRFSYKYNDYMNNRIIKNKAAAFGAGLITARGLYDIIKNLNKPSAEEIKHDLENRDLLK